MESFKTQHKGLYKINFPKKVFVVSHTHWDREWYFTKTSFQMMGVDMMEHLLNTLETHKDFKSFLLDGQLIALEDYLEVYPHQRDTIIRLVKQGRLVLGPWYMLPDEYLASGEAHIRNFLEGSRLAQAFGGGQRLGYLPDSFGHPAQIPQLIKGLGMQELIFWRGPGPEVKSSEFIWEGPDGTAILALNMAFGYSNAANLKADSDIRTKRLDHEIGKLMDISTLQLALLMNGSDHIAPDYRVPKWIEEYSQQRTDLQVHHGSLEDYANEAHARAKHAKLQRVYGELRSGYRAYLLGDTLSTRMPIKQKQRAAEVLAENHIEPLFALLTSRTTSAYPTHKLRFLWKLILQNLPHDSICGCGNDKIHREMMLRYEQIADIGDHLLQEARAELNSPATDFSADGELAVFNPHPSSRVMLVKARLQQVLHPLRYVDYEQDQKLLEFSGSDQVRVPQCLLLTDENGHTIKGSLVFAGKRDTVESNLMIQPTMNRVAEFDCSFTDTLPALAIKKYRYVFVFDEARDEQPAPENEFFILQAAGDGTLSLFDKAAKRWYHGLARLCDVADVGDEYTFDGLMNDHELTLDPMSIESKTQGNTILIQGNLMLPKQCAADRQSRSAQTEACAVSLKASLLHGLPRVDLTVSIDNRARDHRLSVTFPLGSQAQSAQSDALFAVEDRLIHRADDPKAYAGWKEQPNNSFFVKNFTALSTKEHGLAVFVKGLPHGEVKPGAHNDELRLTLLRCVGWLSRNDLKSRAGNGGWSIPTEEAQLLGEHTFELSIRPFTFTQGWQLHQEALAFSVPPLALQTARKGAGSLTGLDPLFELDDERLSLSALKQAEDGRGLILRLMNLSQEVVDTKLRLSQTAVCRLTNLAEEDLDDTSCKAKWVPIHANPLQIVTLRMEFV